MLRTAMLVSTLAALVAGAAHAQTFTFKTIDDPADPTFNQLLGINDQGVIAGYFGSGLLVGHPNKGYIITPPYTVFRGDNLPDSAQTQATGINNQRVTTGFWSPTNLGGGDANYGFIRILAKGAFEYIDVNDPAARSSPVINQLLGINNSLETVGFYNDANGLSHGFAYNVTTAAYTPVAIGGATADAATGINDHNLVSGFFVNAGGATLGFLRPLIGGTETVFRIPGATVTQLLGVNNSGLAVGFYNDPKTGFPHGLIYDPTSGNWIQVDAPLGVNGTVLNGLNNKNQFVGFYTDAATNVHGLLVTTP